MPQLHADQFYASHLSEEKKKQSKIVHENALAFAFILMLNFCNWNHFHIQSFLFCVVAGCIFFISYILFGGLYRQSIVF